MSLMTNVQKDVNDYEEKVFMGLSARMLVCMLVAIALIAIELAIGYLVLHTDIDNVLMGSIVLVTAVLAVMAARWKPMGMHIEKAIPIYMSHYLGDSRIYYRASVKLADDEDGVKKDEGGADAGISKEEVKEYKRICKYRGARSPEYVIPRYYGYRPSPSAQAHEEGAEGAHEGAVEA